MVSEKGRSAGFIDFARSNKKNQLNDIFVRRFKAITVEKQEEIGGGKTSPFVAINKRMIFYDPKQVSSGEIA